MMKAKLVGIAMLLAVPFVAWVGTAGAQSFRSGQNVTIARDQTIEGTVWASGNNIDIAGTIDGDVFCAGQNVTISGTVNGDVLCAGQTIRITGTVNGDIRTAGQNVSVGSKISGNASVAGQSVTLEQSGDIARDFSVAASDTFLNGNVGRDVLLGAGNATLTNTIGRNVNADVERLRLETGAKVNGDLKYASRDAMYLADGAAVAGQTVRTERTHNEDRGGWEGFGAWMGIYMIVSLLLIALAAALLIPRVPHRISDVALRDPLKAGVVGLVAGVLFPILFVSLLFTVIGIPLALFLALVWLAILAAGLLSFSYYLGRLVWKAQRNPLLIMLVGALIFLVVLLVPFLGGLAIFIATCMGTGMVLIKLRDQIRRPIDDRPATKPALHKS